MTIVQTQVRIVPENGRYQIKDATSGRPYGLPHGTYEGAEAEARREGWRVVNPQRREAA